jgi:bacterioferritin-associated ferredoxin
MANALAYPIQEWKGKTSFHDQVQIALAIAEENSLKSLLTDCISPIAQPHRIGAISSTIGIPIKAKKVVDGIIQYEAIDCVLVDVPVETDPQLAEATLGNFPRWRNQSLTRCESETRILGQTVPMSQAIALLGTSGFSPRQVEDILNLPYEAWHKTWWYTVDAEGNFTVPFLRMIRTLRYTDGTFTIQYKDYYSDVKPACFKGQEQKVLIEIKAELDSFSKTLEKINYSRDRCGIDRAILICNSLSELEARGFISQGISIYTATAVNLPIQANCATCIHHNCPMHNLDHSPVVMCRHFELPTWDEEMG